MRNCQEALPSLEVCLSRNILELVGIDADSVLTDDEAYDCDDFDFSEPIRRFRVYEVYPAIRSEARGLTSVRDMLWDQLQRV